MDLGFQEKNKILEPLNAQQKAVVKDYNGLSIVSAGPGSGKTTTVVSKAAYMIADGVPATNILLFTFTRKAAQEIQERVSTMMGLRAAGITMCTYHSFCAKFLRQHYEKVGLRKNFSIFDEADREIIVKKILKDLDYDLPTVDDCIRSISYYKENYILPKAQLAKTDYLPKDNIEKRRSIIYDMYQRLLLENNAADFDDLIMHTITILENHKDIQQYVWNKYRYIMADEGQDSSVLDQRFIFNLIPDHDYNLSFILDSDQSIYAFRGGNFKALFDRLAKYPDCKRFFLEQNYRSTQTIVKASQEVIQCNHRPDAKSIYTANPKGNKIIMLNPKTPVNEANAVASTILHLKNSNQIKEYGDVAILYRNLFLSKDIEDAFMRNKIPYKVISGVSFYERIEIKDITAYLEFIENPQNLVALERIVDIPKVGVGEITFQLLKKELMTAFATYGIIDLDRMVEILGEIIKRNKKLKRVTTFYNNLSIIAAHKDDPPSELIDTILQTINYKEYVQTLKGQKGKLQDEILERNKNLLLLKDLATSYINLREFIDSITLSPDMGNTELEDKKCVKLMSIHAAKGLEFAVTFLIGCNDRIIPSARALTMEDKEEERRLFYVAMTRAKELLILSYPASRLVYGKYTAQNPSPFLSEINKKYVVKY